MKVLAPLLACWIVVPAMATELTIAGQEYPPFNWTSDGALRGGMVAVLRSACERLHYSCSFRILPLARAMKMLEMGELDAVMSLIPNAERAQYAYASPAVVVSPLVYMGRPGAGGMQKDLQALQGWTVAGVRGSTSFQRARANQSLVADQTLIEEVDNQTLLRKLHAGRYGSKGAIIGSEAVLRFDADRLQVPIEPVFTLEYQAFCAMFSKKRVSAQAMEDITRTLQAMKKSGAVRELLQPYGLHAAP